MKTRPRVATKPEPLPPRLDERPSGTPTSMRTRQAAGKAKRRWSSMR
jgi:hypothetical protein